MGIILPAGEYFLDIAFDITAMIYRLRTNVYSVIIDMGRRFLLCD